MPNVGVEIEENLWKDYCFSEPFAIEVFQKKMAQVFMLHGHRRNYAKKSMIFKLSDSANEAYFIEKGRTRTFQITPDGKEVTFDIWNPGSFFGLVELLLDYPRIRYTETMGNNTTLLVMSKEQIIRFVFSNPEICFVIARLIGAYILKYQRLVEDLAMLPVQGRVIQLIVRLAKERGVTVGDSIAIDLPTTHDGIAKMVGSSRQNITSILNSLREQGILDWEKKRIKILRWKDLIDLT